MFQQKVRLEAEEEERALDAKKQYEIEKENAVQMAIEKERKERDEFVDNQIKIIMQKLKEQARMDLDKELALQEKILQVFVMRENKHLC